MTFNVKIFNNDSNILDILNIMNAEGHNAWQFVFVNIVSNNLVINIGERYAQEEDN